MTNNFINRVIEERIVDTKKYRYVANPDGIKRLPIEYTGTVKAIDKWELVYPWK